MEYTETIGIERVKLKKTIKDGSVHFEVSLGDMYCDDCTCTLSPVKMDVQQFKEFTENLKHLTDCIDEFTKRS